MSVYVLLFNSVLNKQLSAIVNDSMKQLTLAAKLVMNQVSMFQTDSIMRDENRCLIGWQGNENERDQEKLLEIKCSLERSPPASPSPDYSSSRQLGKRSTF